MGEQHNAKPDPIMDCEKIGMFAPKHNPELNRLVFYARDKHGRYWLARVALEQPIELALGEQLFPEEIVEAE